MHADDRARFRTPPLPQSWIAAIAKAMELRDTDAMTISEIPIKFDSEEVAEFCRARGIIRLSLFGSVLRDDFDPESSDIDVLAEFGPGALTGVGFRYVRYADELAAILGHPVDFCSRLNKYVEPAVRSEAFPIYERA